MGKAVEMKEISPIILLYLAILLSACQNSTGPDGQTDPCQLVWTADTLLYPGSVQTMMGAIWGSSANDVYTVGHCDCSTSGTMYHYDGKVWEPVKLSQTVGGPLKGAIFLKHVFGFSPRDVYAVGEKTVHSYDEPYGVIIHYNGHTWEDIDIPQKEWLRCIYGDAPDNVWAAGNQNTLFHYNGSQWQTDSLPHPGYPGFEVSIAGKTMTGDSINGIYLATYSIIESVPWDHLFMWDGNHWCVQDSGMEYTEKGINRLWMSPSGTLYKTSYDGVHQRINDQWEAISEDMSCFGIHGTADDNIFITADLDGGRVFHYNGADWYEYEELHFTDVVYYHIFTIEGEVFVTGRTLGGFPNKTIIWHGR